MNSIALEDNERTFAAQVTKSVFSKYANIPLQKKLNVDRSDGGEGGTIPELNCPWDCRWLPDHGLITGVVEGLFEGDK